MRYSEIIISYHRIELTQSNAYAADIFFTGASHSYSRWKETIRGSRDERFHDVRFQAHLKHLCEVIYTGGNFSKAIDPTRQGFEIRETWILGDILRRDPRMFNEMTADPRYLIGQDHPNDKFLTSL